MNRDIKGFENYTIDTVGRAFSKKSKKYLQQIVNCGYLKVTLYRKGYRKPTSIHRIMADNFLGVRKDGMEVRHLDGNKMNNNLSNLAYGTKSDNQKDRVVHGTSNRGSRNGNAKLTREDVMDIVGRIGRGESRSDIAVLFGVHKTTIDAIVNPNKKEWKWLVGGLT